MPAILVQWGERHRLGQRTLSLNSARAGQLRLAADEGIAALSPRSSSRDTLGGLDER